MDVRNNLRRAIIEYLEQTPAANMRVTQETARSRRAGNLSREVHPPHRNIVLCRLFREQDALIFNWYATEVATMPVDLKPPDKPPPDRDGLWTVFVFTLIAVGVASAYYLWNNSAP